MNTPYLVRELIKVVVKRRLFWPTWLATSVGAAIGVARSVGRQATPSEAGTDRAAPSVKARGLCSRGAVAALAFLALLLAAEIALTLAWDDFTYEDGSMFTQGFLKGHDLGPQIWRENGRFFPLGHQEFNLIRRFASTAAGYQVLPILQLLVVCGVLLILDHELSLTASAGLTALVLISPAVVASFGGLIFTERNIVFWLCLLLLCRTRYEQTLAAKWAVGAVVCAQFMIYYKETAFLVLLGLAAGNLLLRCKRTDQAGWEFARLRDKESRLDLYLASLGILFPFNYILLMAPHLNIQYAHEDARPILWVVLAYLEYDLLAWGFVAVVLRRIYLILRNQTAPSPLWDGLACGGVVCFAAYLYLRMYSAYYLAAVDFIGVLYLGRLAILSWGRRTWATKAPIVALLGAIVVQDCVLSCFRAYERKNVIHAKVEIGNTVLAQYHGAAGEVRGLFFPFASSEKIMEFACYLGYRGVPVEGLRDGAVGVSRVVMAGRSVAKDGQCVDFRPVICHSRRAPEPGDLVVILPEDDAFLAQVASYQEEGKRLFSYEPYPPIPRRLFPFVRDLHFASYAFTFKHLPDHWLHASVSRW